MLCLSIACGRVVNLSDFSQEHDCTYVTKFYLRDRSVFMPRGGLAKLSKAFQKS